MESPKKHGKQLMLKFESTKPMHSLSRDIPPYSHAARLKLAVEVAAAAFNPKSWGQHGHTTHCVSNASPITQVLVGEKITYGGKFEKKEKVHGLSQQKREDRTHFVVLCALLSLCNSFFSYLLSSVACVR